MKAIIIAGTQSGVGKTTITVGLIAALRARGLAVQPFKVGPDYLDPTYHRLASGRPCRNLDTWMIDRDQVRSLFQGAVQDVDFALVEGVMGLHDGLGYSADTGSTAEVAKLLDLPVVLVVDAAKMARSAAAVVLGCQRFDPAVRLAGVIVNRVGSDDHGRGVTSAIEQATGLPVLGWLPRDGRLHVAERHLGLVPTVEPGRWAEFIDAARDAVAGRLNMTRLQELAGEVAPSRPQSRQGFNGHPRPLLAVARDEGFHFLYEENLEMLEQAGAEIAFFSPLRDEGLPDGTSGVLLSGGFPEMFANDLAANRGMHESLREAHARDVPIYAECGGLMYLTEAIVDPQGSRHTMIGLLPGTSVMTGRLTLGYRQAQAATSNWLLERGAGVRGHEFHYSSWRDRPADLPAAYLLSSPHRAEEPRPDGACVGSLFASYLHLHFWGKPELAGSFVEACGRTARRQKAGVG